jgi:DNA-binding response OmpR family regulator
MDGYLTKPIRGQELDAVLTTYAEQKSGQPSPESQPVPQLTA